MTNIFLLMGGLQSFDGPLTSSGMYILRGMLAKLPNVIIKTYLWRNWMTCHQDILGVQQNKIALIGFSGGAAHATWVACGYNGGYVNLKTSFGAKPRIDLLVSYDASPKNATFTLDKNVRRAVDYYNRTPLMLGLGGGKLMGNTDIETIEIREQHFMVQFDMTLHRRTVEEVRRLSS